MKEIIRKLTGTQLIFLVLIFFISAGYYFKYNIWGNVYRSKVDFNGFYYGAKCFFEGYNPYNHKHLMFLRDRDGLKEDVVFTPYLPHILFIFRPLNFFTIRTAQFIWLVFSNLLFGWGVYLLIKNLFIYFENNTDLFVYSAAFLFFSVHYFPATVWDNSLGNINSIIFFLFTAAIYSYTKKRYNITGLCFGLAVILKVMPVVFIPFFLIKKKFRVLLTAFILIVLLIGTTAAFKGIESYRNWLKVIPAKIYHPEPRPFNQSVKAFFMRLFSEKSFVTLTEKSIFLITDTVIVLAGLILLYYIFIFRKSDDKIIDELLFSMSIIYLFFSSTYAWETWYVYLIPVYIFILKYLFTNTGHKNNLILILMFLISFILIGIDFPYREPQYTRGYLVFFSSIKLYGAILLFISILIILNSIKKKNNKLA